jgi:hypothetical protein
VTILNIDRHSFKQSSAAVVVISHYALYVAFLHINYAGYSNLNICDTSIIVASFASLAWEIS